MQLRGTEFGWHSNMLDTWDISVLIDSATRIHDARGMASEHFGVSLRELSSRVFIDFVAPEQRAAFRRCMAKVAGGKDMRLMAAKLLTCEPEPRTFYLMARRAKEPDRWWLMIAAESTQAPAGIEQMSSTPVMAEEGEFIAMVEAAASQMGDRAEMTRIDSALLAGKVEHPQATPAVKQRLESDFDKIVLDNSVDGVATRQGPGEYVLVKDREKPAEEIVGQLAAAAEALAIPTAALGLTAASVGLDKVKSEAGIAQAMAKLRTPPAPDRDEWGEPLQRKSWIRRAIDAAAASF